MFPGSASLARAALLIVLATAVPACSTAAQAEFDPSGPCSADGRLAGAYPDLEALVPTSFDGAPPTRLDSGRNCSEGRLGSLAGHGIDEVRFAGALWETDRRSGVTIAVFEAPGLTVDRLAEFYEAGARGARKTENVTTSRFAVGSLTGRRLDTLNGQSFQSVVVLDGPAAGQVRAVLVASDVAEAESRAVHDQLVERAAETAVAG